MKNINFIFILMLLFLPFDKASPAVIDQDNFDTWDTFSCTTHACADPHIQEPWASLGLTDSDGLTVGVDPSYGRSGKGWRTTYNGGFKGAGLNLGTYSSQSEVYVRFYMKFGTNAHWSPPIENGMKIFRFGLDPELFRLEFGHSGDGLYIIPDGNPNIYPRDYGGTTYTWAMFNNGVNDTSYGGNVWRCVEVHGKLGASLGTDTVDIWIDGTNILHATNVRLRSSTGTYFTAFSLGDNAEYLIGDLYFDDLILSTTYIGTDSGDTTAPTASITTSSPQTIYTDSLTVTGTASDAVGVSSCKYRIGSAPDGSNGTACTGTTSWSCSTSGYSLGANTLYVGCGDAAGNWGSNSMVVNFVVLTNFGCSFSGAALGGN